MRLLGVISLLQLLLGIAGLRKGLREGRGAELPPPAKPSTRPLTEGHWLEGTALSAPTAMLIAQGIATVVLIVHPRPPAFFARILGALGAMMTFGYPLEKVWRDSLVEPDKHVTPITLGGFLLALKMAMLGWSVGRGRAAKAIAVGAGESADAD